MLAPSLDTLAKNMECEEQSPTSSLDIVIKWNGNDYDVKKLNTNSDVKTLKEEIFKCTGVRPERQKLINLRISGKYIRLYLFFVEKFVIQKLLSILFVFNGFNILLLLLLITLLTMG